MRAFDVGCAILATCLGVATPPCFANCGKTSESAVNLALEHSPTSIQSLAKELRGKTGEEVANTIVKQFGPAARDVGSGLSIKQWDVESGVLTHSVGLASFRYKRGNGVVWLTETLNKAMPTLTANTFEMYTRPSPQMKYWLGNLHLKSDSTYKFIDSGDNLDHRTDQQQSFFMTHPDGRFEINFAPGCTSDTVLERVADGTFLCSLTFLPTNGGPQVGYDIVVYASERRLAFSTSRRPLMFLMEKAFAL